MRLMSQTLPKRDLLPALCLGHGHRFRPFGVFYFYECDLARTRLRVSAL